MYIRTHIYNAVHSPRGRDCFASTSSSSQRGSNVYTIASGVNHHDGKPRVCARVRIVVSQRRVRFFILLIHSQLRKLRVQRRGRNTRRRKKWIERNIVRTLSTPH